jgi:hypothetical protein
MTKNPEYDTAPNNKITELEVDNYLASSFDLLPSTGCKAYWRVLLLLNKGKEDIDLPVGRWLMRELTVRG